MAGGAADSQFTGLAKYFNSTTMSGRANVIFFLSFISFRCKELFTFYAFGVVEFPFITFGLDTTHFLLCCTQEFIQPFTLSCFAILFYRLPKPHMVSLDLLLLTIC